MARGRVGPALHPFDHDTAVRPLGDGRYEAALSRRWWIARGPNGGYLAAIILRALTVAVADPERHPRSLTVHYLRAPEEGALTLVPRVERTGRSLTTLTLRAEQGSEVVALAVAAFSRGREGVELDESAPPELPPLEDCVRLRVNPPLPPPLVEMFDMRWGLGPPPFSGGERAEAGGYIRAEPPRAADAPFVALVADAYPPPVFGRLDPGRLAYAPTIDLTVHFRTPLPHPGVGPEDHLRARFRSRRTHEGFFEEDGEIYAADGTLLAQSRQLALLLVP